jgi:hypothetical protein
LIPVPEVSKAAYEEALAKAREAQKERDTARQELKVLQAHFDPMKAAEHFAHEECERLKEERVGLKALRESSLEMHLAERDKLKADLEKAKAQVAWRDDRLVELSVSHDKLKGQLDVVQRIVGRLTLDRRNGEQEQATQLNRKDSLMRRLFKSAWKFVIVPSLVFSAAAHVVPLSSVYEAARFESRGAFHEFQVCAKCSASRAGGAVCPACGSRESSSLVGREVTRAFLGVWPRETRWTAEGEIAREAR